MEDESDLGHEFNENGAFKDFYNKVKLLFN
jgi:hypothetical protein